METVANCITLWLCVLQPAFFFWLGWRIASAGGVSPFFASVLEKIGQETKARPTVGSGARGEDLLR